MLLRLSRLALAFIGMSCQKWKNLHGSLSLFQSTVANAHYASKVGLPVDIHSEADAFIHYLPKSPNKSPAECSACCHLRFGLDPSQNVLLLFYCCTIKIILTIYAIGSCVVNLPATGS